jgi:hypothetical protein
MVDPLAAVYLDNLESSKNTETPVKVTNRSEVVTDEENFEDDLNHKRTTSRAKITKKVALNDAQSVSSMDPIKSVEDMQADQPRCSSESMVASETASVQSLTSKKNSPPNINNMKTATWKMVDGKVKILSDTRLVSIVLEYKKIYFQHLTLLFLSNYRIDLKKNMKAFNIPR